MPFFEPETGQEQEKSVNPGTNYYSVVIEGSEANLVHHPDSERAEEFEYKAKAKGFSSKTFGDICGPVYVVVYYQEVGQ